jgi:DNA processing protein
MGPGRLTAVVGAFGFAEGWSRVRLRRLDEHPGVARSLGPKAREVQDQWASLARSLDPGRLLADHRAAEIEVVVLGDDRYPAALAADLEPPAVLFARGDLDLIAGTRVAIVGTRRCTRGGRLTALEMGRELAAAGIRVVSGLALGIDGAAHEGVLGAEPGAPPIGVVGTGLDVVYPTRHARLWDAVAHHGVLVSESPLGGTALPWRFPARNRIIAALSQVVVVVESHASGGALHTVDEALRRDRTILAVPGSVRSPAAAGTNGLLHDGMGPARDATDVLTALGLEGASHPDLSRADPTGPEQIIDPDDDVLLDLLDGGPMTLDALATRSQRDLGDLAVTMLRLEQQGRVERSGTWIERVNR